MANVIPPDTRAAGQTGHIDDHNNIADVLTAMQSQLSALPAIVQGSAALSAGSVTVPSSTVTSSSLIYLSRETASGTPGTLTWAVSAGVSFTITSSSASDTSTVAYLILT